MKLGCLLAEAGCLVKKQALASWVLILGNLHCDRLVRPVPHLQLQLPLANLRLGRFREICVSIKRRVFDELKFLYLVDFGSFARNINCSRKGLPTSRKSVASFMKGVSPSDSSLHEKSEVFGFAIHIPTGVNTTPVQ